MLRLLTLFALLALTLDACRGGYYSCERKIKDSHTIRKDSLYIPVKNNKIVLYSPSRPDAKILKYDPFLSLYLIEDTKKFAYPFDINMRLQLGTAVVDARHAHEGHIVKNQIGLNSLAQYTYMQKSPALPCQAAVSY